MSESVDKNQSQRQAGDTKKIAMIYLVVAIICAIIISCFMFLGKYMRKAAEQTANDGEKSVVQVQVMSMEESIGLNDILRLEEDFTATNQDGEVVTLQSLKGKVWVFAQFYGSCPECNKVNFEILTGLYEKYKGDPNFQLVTVSVMEEEDGVKAMKNMADILKAETDKWWFLTADVNEVNEFCHDHMLYLKFEENTNKDGNGMEGAIFHDMGIAVFNADMIMKTKVDVYSQLQAKNDLGAELKKKELDLEVAAALEALNEN